MKFRKIISKLEKTYGRPEQTISRDPFEMVLYENLAYLVDDEKRIAAFQTLKNEVGLLPSDILKAPLDQLTRIASIGGILARVRAQRIKECALIVLNEFDGNLSSVLNRGFSQASKALRQFDGIGQPGAEKILLFSHNHPTLAPESNGLRVLLRLGFGEEKKNYSTSYKSAKVAVEEEDTYDCDFLIKAHQLLRRHGKELCKRNNPLCQKCPLKQDCRYFLTTQTGA